MKNKFSIAMSLAVIMAMLLTSFALADDVHNDIVAVPASIGLQAGDVSSYADVQFYVQAQGVGADGDAACNFDNTAEKVTFAINTPTGVTADPSTLTFNKCHDGSNFNYQSVRFSAGVSAVSGNVSFTQTANNSGGTFDYDQAVFYVNVTPSTPSDTTGPVISKTITGTTGTNGWYTSDVTVVWSVSDAESGVVIDSGCGTQSFTSETTGVVSSCSAHSAGGTASDSVTIKIDKTGPSASLSANGTAGSNGWYVSDVTITTSGSDTISNPTTCTVIQTQTTDTTGAIFNGSCTNAAGLTTAATALTVKRDATAPTAALSVSVGTPGANGWYTSDVTVHTSGTGSVSGVTCTADQYQSSETIGTIFNGSCTSGAGLSTNASPLIIKLDKSGPTAVLSASGTLGSNGWYTSNVTVSTSGSDTISSPVTCTAAQSLTADSTGTVFNGSCTNDAGLSTNASPLTVKRDATAPTLAPTVSPNPVLLNDSAIASANANDVTSDVASSGCDAVATNAVGTFNVNCSATDNAGNTATANASYTVSYKVCALYDQTKAHKSGSTVPVKLQLCDVNGVNYSAANIVVNATSVKKLDNTAGALEDSGYANSPDMNFRYDASLGGYIFNLSLKGYTTGTWQLFFTVDGAGSYSVKFDVK